MLSLPALEKKDAGLERIAAGFFAS